MMPKDEDTMGTLSPRQQILLKEYEKAQDSAEHYNSLLWQAIGIIVALNAGAIAVAGKAVADAFWGDSGMGAAVLALVVSCVGFFIVNPAGLALTEKFRSLQRAKLYRCRQIERSFAGIVAMRQHSDTNQLEKEASGNHDARSKEAHKERRKLRKRSDWVAVLLERIAYWLYWVLCLIWLHDAICRAFHPRQRIMDQVIVFRAVVLFCNLVFLAVAVLGVIFIASCAGTARTPHPLYEPRGLPLDFVGRREPLR